MYGETVKTESVPQPDYTFRIDNVNNRVDNLRDALEKEANERIRLERKLRLLIAYLIDKKIIGEEIGSILINETEINPSKVDWYLKEIRRTIN